MRQVAKQISAENRGVAEFTTAPYVPPQLDDKSPADLRDAHDYYLTPRAQHPRAENKILVRSVPPAMNFDAFYLADLFLKQPTLLIAGDKAESRWHTDKLDKVLGGATEKVIVPKGTHMDFYDRAPFVDPAVLKVA